MRARTIAGGILSLILLTIGCSSNESSTGTTGGTGGTGTGGSGGSTGGSPPAIPDHVVNELRQHGDAVPDDAYPARVVTQFRTTDALPDLDAKSLAVVGPTVYAGTASGLARWQDGDAAFAAVPLTGAGAVVDLAVTSDGRLAAARADGVELLTAQGGAGEIRPVAGETIAAVAAHGTEIWIGTDQGLSRLDSMAQTPIAPTQGVAIRDLAIAGDVVWMATANGVRRWDIAASKLLPDIAGTTLLTDDDVRALALSADGTEILAAAAQGLSRVAIDGGASTKIVPGEGGLPSGDLTAIADVAGETITGHAVGATVMSATLKEHFHSLRWIPDEAVTAVAIGPDQSRWIATHQGISRVALVDTKLADKAAQLAPLAEELWRMEGFVDDEVGYADPWDPSAAPQHSDKDNDGLWTEMQIASWCFAYAVTKDEAYYQNARKAMDTMFLLVDVPGETFAAKGMKRGFVARSLVRDDEGALFDEKAGNDHWVKQDFKGHTYYWKNDTSSDEYAGHFFGMPVFYDLCAKTEDEKQALRDRIDLVMGYVVDGGDELIDLDGEPTTFGRWKDLASAVDGDLGACLAAGKPNCAESYGGGGWLNAIEILGHLLAAWHITGDDRYYDEYERLAITERYGDMIPLTDHTLTVTSRHAANHSDHELASLAYYTLLRYEPHADRREKWQASLMDFFGYEKAERNAFEIAVIASAMEGGDIPSGVRTLREMPSDFRQWLVDNSHRVDAKVDPVLDRFDDPQFTTVLPYGEIRTMKWNGNPYVVKGGGSGKSVQGPWPWLLPYWMMRYSGAIVP